MAWIVCGVFVLLLMSVGVRKVLIVMQQRAETKPETRAESIDNLQEFDPVTAPQEDVVTLTPEVEMVPAPPKVEPAPARTLPTTLIVGDEEGEYESLQQALDDIISGDTIELRTDAPQRIHAEIKGQGLADDERFKLQIRGSKGTTPLIIPATNGPLMSLEFADVSLDGLCIAAVDATWNSSFISATGCRIDAYRCAFVKSPVIPNASEALLVRDRQGLNTSLSVQDCFFRRVEIYKLAKTATAADIKIDVSNSVCVAGTAITAALGPELSGSFEISIEHSNILNGMLLELWTANELREDLDISLYIRRSVGVLGLAASVRPDDPEAWLKVGRSIGTLNDTQNAYSLKLGFAGIREPSTKSWKPISTRTEDVFESYDESGSYVGSNSLAKSFSMSDFIDVKPEAIAFDRSTHPLLKPFRRKNIQVGCNVSKLLVPPPLPQ